MKMSFDLLSRAAFSDPGNGSIDALADPYRNTQKLAEAETKQKLERYFL